jgi:hypothetical protein
MNATETDATNHQGADSLSPDTTSALKITHDTNECNDSDSMASDNASGAKFIRLDEIKQILHDLDESATRDESATSPPALSHPVDNIDAVTATSPPALDRHNSSCEKAASAECEQNFSHGSRSKMMQIGKGVANYGGSNNRTVAPQTPPSEQKTRIAAVNLNSSKSAQNANLFSIVRQSFEAVDPVGAIEAIPPSHLTDPTDVPELINHFCPPDNGVWISANDSSGTNRLEYVYWNNSELVKSSYHAFGTFDRCRAFTNHDGNALLHTQDTVGVSCNHALFQVHCSHDSDELEAMGWIQLTRTTETKVTVSVSGSFYMLYQPFPDDITKAWTLVYWSRRITNPKTLLTNVPHATRLYPCSSGCVWLEVGGNDDHDDEPNGSDAFAPGLWHVIRWKTHRVVTGLKDPDEKNHLIAVDAMQRGMWLLRPHEDSHLASCVLTHVDRKCQVREQIIALPFQKIQAMTNAGMQRDGVFLHYRGTDCWKIGLVSMGSSSSVENFYDCARHAKIASCGLDDRQAKAHTSCL